MSADDTGSDRTGSNGVDTVPDGTTNTWAPAFWAILVVIGLAIFVWNFSEKILAEAGDIYPAAHIGDLASTMFLVAVIGGGSVLAIVAYTVFRHSRPNREEATPLLPGHGKYTLTMFATGVTFLMVATMIMGAGTLAITDESNDPLEQFDTDRTLGVDVTAAQFLWTLDVDDGLDAQEDEMVIPADTVIHFETQSEDVIHSFAIQDLGVKKDAVPGTTNDQWFMVGGEVDGEETVQSRTGAQYDADEYTVTCAELCGDAHSQMIATVYVLDPDDYESYVEDEGGELPESFTEGGD